MNNRTCVIWALTLLVAIGARAQTTIVRYVDPRATGANNGSSWQNAFTSLQSALLSSVASQPIDLRVAGQTYAGPFDLVRPAAAGPLRVLGGYRGLGAGGSPDDRNIETFATVLDGQGVSRALRITAPNLQNPTLGEAVILEGLTLRNGLASGAGADGFGGAIHVAGSGSLLISRCLFEDNRAEQGGALHWDNAGAPNPAPSIRRCAFVGNSAAVKGGAALLSVNGLRIEDCAFDLNGCDASGGALTVSRSVRVDRCSFTGNSAALDGGAVALESTAPGLRDSLFHSNIAGDDGGAVHIRVGADSPLVISGCSFFDNAAAARGGAAFISGFDTAASSPSVRARVDNCLFFGNHGADGGGLYDFNAVLDMVSCAFSGNTASVRGGGYSSNRNNQTNDGVRRVVNCTFSHNSAPSGGAIARHSGNSINNSGPDGAFLQVRNALFQQNGCAGIPPCGSAVAHTRNGAVSSGTSQIVIDNCAADQAADAFVSPTSSILFAASNLLEINPSMLLTRPRGLDDVAGTPDDDLTLRPSSPCVDWGSNAALLTLTDLSDMDSDSDTLEAPPLDLSRRARRQDTIAPDPPISTPPVVDIGAYEVPFCQPCPGESAWQFALSGGFGDVPRWIGGAPDSARDVLFDRPGEYTVSFSAGAQNRSASIRAGSVRFDLNGRLWNLTAASTTPFAVGEMAGDDAIAIIDGGALLSGAGVIGRDAGSRGAVTLTSPGASWEVAQSLSVGLNGSGSLRITEDTLVFSLLGGVGEQPGALGMAIIEGPGAVWEILFTLSVSRGVVEVREGGTLDVGLATVIFPGGAIEGDGVIASDVINFGAVRPDASDPLGFAPGVLTVLGDYEQLGELPQVGDETGALAVRIGAHHASGQIGASRLDVEGRAELAGGLIVTSSPGFDATGQPLPALTLLRAEQITGRFDAALLPGLGDGRYFYIEYLEGQGVDSVALATQALAPGFGFEPDVGAIETGEPGAIIAADLNGDGFDDVALALPSTDSVVVLFSAGADGSGWLGFQSPALLVSVGDQPTGVGAGDFDGDGLPDLAVCLAGANAVQVLLNNGAGGFQTPGPAQTFAVGFEPRALAAADLDGDGDEDLAVACFASDSVVFLAQEASPMPGHVILDRVLDFAVGDGPRAITVIQSPADLFPQLVTSNLNDDTITFIRNAGELRIGLQSFDAPAGEDPDNARPGDLDEDKDIDLIVASEGGASTPGAVSILRNLGDYQFAPAVQLPIGGVPRSLAVVDLDLDGDDDIAAVVVDDMGVGVVRVLRNDLTGHQIAFAPAEDFSGVDPLLVIAADVDDDMNQDLVIISAVPSEDPLRAPPSFAADVALNAFCAEDLNGDGEIGFFELNLVVSAFNTGPGEPAYIAGADVNGDELVNFADLNAVLGRFNGRCDEGR